MITKIKWWLEDFELAMYFEKRYITPKDNLFVRVKHSIQYANSKLK